MHAMVKIVGRKTGGEVYSMQTTLRQRGTEHSMRSRHHLGDPKRNASGAEREVGSNQVLPGTLAVYRGLRGVIIRQAVEERLRVLEVNEVLELF